MAVLLFAMTTAVMGYYQKETEPIDIPGRTPSGTSAPQPSATPEGEVIPSVDRQAELAEARAKNPDTVAWLYIPGAEVDDPVMQAEDNGYYLKLDENGEYAMWGCYYAHCENEIGVRDKLDKNTTIFGHSASNCDPDGVRFTKLYRYMDADFAKEHPYIYKRENNPTQARHVGKQTISYKQHKSGVSILPQREQTERRFLCPNVTQYGKKSP